MNKLALASINTHCTSCATSCRTNTHLHQRASVCTRTVAPRSKWMFQRHNRHSWCLGDVNVIPACVYSICSTSHKLYAFKIYDTMWSPHASWHLYLHQNKKMQWQRCTFTSIATAVFQIHIFLVVLTDKKHSARCANLSPVQKETEIEFKILRFCWCFNLKGKLKSQNVWCHLDNLIFFFFCWLWLGSLESRLSLTRVVSNTMNWDLLSCH